MNFEFSDTSVEFLAAHCFAFFFAGYATQNLTLSAGLLELARHPEVQSKLRAEIDEHFEKEGGKITYDALKKMKYLEQVILGKAVESISNRHFSTIVTGHNTSHFLLLTSCA